MYDRILGWCWRVEYWEREKRDGPRMTFIKQVCRDATTQTYMEIERTAENKHRWRGCFTSNQKAEKPVGDGRAVLLCVYCCVFTGVFAYLLLICKNDNIYKPLCYTRVQW